MKIPNEHRKHFLGKICTIFTTPMNRDFQQEDPNKYPEQVYKYFVGVIHDITDYGILIQQVMNGLKSWIFLSHVICIAEEEVEYLTEDDVKTFDKPQHVARTSDLKQQFPNEFPEFDSKNPQANMEALKKVAELVKKQNQQGQGKPEVPS